MIRFDINWFRSHFSIHFMFSLVAYIIDLGLLMFFRKVMGFHYLLSAFLSFSAGMFFMYACCVKYIFDQKSPGHYKKEVSSFFAFSLMGLGILQLSLWILTGKLKMPLLISKISATGAVYLWNYLTRKYIVFRH